eukprot:15444157-Alexandrium_andersonii.AAC.1
MRFDASFLASSLQAELKSPAVKSLVVANQALKEARQEKNFALTFGLLDLDGCGIVAVSDAALGNVAEAGSAEADPVQR